MEVIMSPPVREDSVMENGKGDGSVKLTKSKKKIMSLTMKIKDLEACNARLEKELESFRNREDTASGLGKTAFVDKKMPVSSSVATTGDKKSSISGMEIEKGDGVVKVTRSQKKKLKASVESLDKREDTENTKSNLEVSFNIISPSSLQNNDNPYGGISTTATVDLNNRVASSSATGDEKSSVSKIEAPSDEMGLSMIKNLNVEVKTQNKMETAVGETGLGSFATDNTASKKSKRPKKKKNPESGDILSTCENTQDITVTVDQNNSVSISSAIGDEKCPISKIEAPSGEMGSSTITNLNVEVNTLNKMETAVGETGSGTNATDNTESKKRKRPKKKKNNPESGDILSTCENTQFKTTTVCQNNRVTSHSATDDEKSLISKIEASSGKSGSSMITSLNAEVKTQNKMETGVGGMGSGTDALDNTASKKRKSSKKKKNNPESCDVLSTHENTLDKTATPDANMVSKGEDNTKVANDNMGSSASTNINVNDMINPDKKPESKDKSSAFGEISNPGHIQVAIDDYGSRKNSETTHELGKRKRKESEREKLASSAYLSTSESTLIAKKDWSTTKVGETMNGAEEKKTKPRRNLTMLTLGEILDPQYLEALETGIGIKNMENNKRPILNKNLASSGVMSTYNRMQPAELEIAEGKANTTLPTEMVKQNTEVQVKTQVTSLGKKLVIFDVNGLLADIVSPPPLDIMADYHIPRRAIFKRPFLDDFLSFCFERFHVGIWSSRAKHNLHPVVNFLLGDLKKKLVFLWDSSKCTNPGIRTLEDRHKYLVLKDLRKIWLNGIYNESNTLLLDDSPYKALVNPKHSGIFPVSYSYKNRDDNLLAPKGELQNYLEGLAASDNVKTYVEQHPFGQGVIDERHPNWSFYARVLSRVNFR